MPSLWRTSVIAVLLGGLARAQPPRVPAAPQDREDRADVALLARSLKIEELTLSQRLLWPRRPELIGPLTAWLAEAAEVLRLQPEYERALEARRRKEARKPEDPVARWWVVQFTTLEEEVEKLRELRADVQARLDAAESVEQETIGRFQSTWDEARRAIATSGRYGGLALPEIVGLVPLGPDPVTGLWEFLHPESGEAPERDAASGRWIITGSTGVILVLVPGGTRWLGVQKSDPEGPNYDPHTLQEQAPRQVALDPFLISKYELTQGQWLHLNGRNPAQYQPDAELMEMEDAVPVTLAHPVELVTYRDCKRVLFHAGLELPTAEQWEYACRAGTDTPWWTGREPESVVGAANVCDRAYDAVFPAGRSADTWLDDGHVIHAPVGCFRPNDFGLFDTLGNVFEWVHQEDGNNSHIWGGGFVHSVMYCRSTTLFKRSREYSSYYVGVRPALSLPAR